MSKKNKKKKTTSKSRTKLATIYEPVNKEVGPILRRAHHISGMKAKGVGFGAFILMSAMRDATNMIELAAKLMKEEEENEQQQANETEDVLGDEQPDVAGDSDTSEEIS